MKILLALLVAMPLYARDPILPGKIVDNFVRAVETNDQLPDYIWMGVDNMIGFTVRSLREQGFNYDADRINSEWLNTQRPEFQKLLYAKNSRSIPDHKPLIAWLDSVMQTVIEKMGRPFCVSSHICDIYSFNKTVMVGLNVILSRCDFDLPTPSTDRKNEHRACMNTDGVFSGLYSVVVYWVAMGSCLAAGGNFICSPIAMVAQTLCENRLCGPLADRVYSKKCATPPQPQF